MRNINESNRNRMPVPSQASCMSCPTRPANLGMVGQNFGDSANWLYAGSYDSQEKRSLVVLSDTLNFESSSIVGQRLDIPGIRMN